MLFRSLGVARRVLFTGYVNDATLHQLYRRCTVFAMPSHGEGFGFVYLEAMRVGKPCIALADSSAAEIIVDAETGLLVERGVEPLAAALSALLGDPARAAALGAAGLRRWEERFRPSRFANELRPLLDELLEMTPVGAREDAPRRSSSRGPLLPREQRSDLDSEPAADSPLASVVRSNTADI